MRNIFLIIIILATFEAAAQQPSVTSRQHGSETVNPFETGQILERYDQRFEIMDSLVFGDTSDVSAELQQNYAEMDFIVQERIEAIDEAVEAQIRTLKSNTGLDISGQAYVRPGKQLSYDPDDPLVSYNAKIQAELEWNIFNNAIYKSASKIRELRLKGELRQLEHEKEALAETIFHQKTSVKYRYYGNMLSVLRVHSENLKLLLETQIHLLQNGKISSDDLLKIINEQAEIERQLVAINADAVVEELAASKHASYISVPDTAALIRHIREEHRDMRKLSMQNELLEARYRNVDYLQTMDILTFARLSYYNRANARNTHNIDIGVSFKIPLTAETARKRQEIKAEQNIIQTEEMFMGDQIEREVTALLRELENYNENIRGEHERMKSLQQYLRMRIDSYGNVEGEYSRIDRLQEYNAYLQAWERMLTYAYQRDCLLIELQGYITDEPVSRFLTFQEMN